MDPLSLSKEDIGKKLEDTAVVAVKKIYGNNGFVIFACKDGFTVKGNLAGELIEGAAYIVSGTVGEYGGRLQVIADSITLQKSEDNEEKIIASFLEDEIDGIGSKSASALASRYKREVLEVLSGEPHQIAKEIPGISLRKAKQISPEIEARKKDLDLMLELRFLGLSKNQSDVVLFELGNECVNDIRRNPYVLMRIKGIGFDACDKAARTLEHDLSSIPRVAAALESVLSDLHSRNGNTWFPPHIVKNETMALIKNSSDGVLPYTEGTEPFEQGVEYAVASHTVAVYKFKDDKCMACAVDDPDARIALHGYLKNETGIKREIESFIMARKKDVNREHVMRTVNELASEYDMELDDLQKEALFLCMTSPIAIITGGPGTGKTTITGILARHLKKKRIKAVYCAPTGRAAKRLTEAAGVRASTIHRLLEMTGDEGEIFGKNRNDPIDARAVIMDEASMVDTVLFYALLQAIKPDSSLILIGDPDQLPSVGPGNILADLLSVSVVPSVRLKYVFRTGEESSIASNSVRILLGQVPVGGGEDFTIINTSSDEEAFKKAVELYSSYASKEEDFAVLCPTKQNLLGTISLNEAVQEASTGKAKITVKVRSDYVLRCGDRIMQIKNNYKIEYYDPETMQTQRGVFNGEIGTVESIDPITGEAVILFDGDRRIRYDRKLLADTDLAYAMTVHKAQGCEFENVIIVLGQMNRLLSNRKLLYTAVTRGKKNVTIINSCGRLEKMVAGTFTEKRNTSLSDLLKIMEKRYL